MRHALLVGPILLISCAEPGPGPATAARRSGLASSTSSNCIDPVDLGAVAGDGASDRVAIQTAIDSAAGQPNGGTVCVGPGVWTLDRAPIGSYNRFAALSTHGRYLTIRCEDAVLELPGDQGGSTTILLSLDPSAEHIRVTGCTFDSSGATNTAEQTHAIATTGVCSGATCQPIRNIEVDHNRFVWPRALAGRKGDCVRLLGNVAPSATEPGTEVYGVKVHSNDGDCSGRSFVEIQRGVHNLVVDRNTTTCGDQCVDGEATGVVGQQGRPTGIVIVNNTFADGPDAQADFSIALTSVTGAVVANNTMPRGIALYRSDKVAIVGNVIRALMMTSARGVVDVANSCEGLTFAGNVIERAGVAGPVVALAPHSGTTCSGVSIAGNTITQGTVAFAISLESASRASVTANRIDYPTPAPSYSAIYARSVLVGHITESLLIANNLITGAVTYGVTIEGYPGQLGAGISVQGNVATGTMFGIRATEPTYFTAPLVLGGNTMGPGVYSGVTVTTGD
jgi:hypothetical protein